MGRRTEREAGADPVDRGSRDENELSPAEAARERRRDRDAEARTRAGMRTGLAKQFKQVLDVQRRRAEEVERREEKASDPGPRGTRTEQRRKS